MKKSKVRILWIVAFLPGCALFSPPVDNSKAMSLELSNLKEELRIQREEIQSLELKLKKIREEKPKPLIVKAPPKKNWKLEKKKLKAAKKVPVPTLEQDATIADSSHEELHKYFRGVQLLREKKVDDGLIQLREFISENPNHIYADRAEMLIASTHLKNRDFGLVVVSTNVLENRYPHSTKLPEALYLRATAFSELQQREEAKNALERIVKEYPGDPVAKRAKEKLASMSTPLLQDTP